MSDDWKGVPVDKPLGTPLVFELTCGTCLRPFKWETVHAPFSRGGQIPCPHCGAILVFQVINIGPSRGDLQ